MSQTIMKEHPLISIIVPVYNTAPWLDSCIQSILSQSLSDYELLLIDDGSTDGCGRICDSYAARDPRIYVIHQEHRGQSSARNVGLDICNGEYITMVDSDDVLLSPDYLKLLYEVLRSENAMISTVGCHFIKDGSDVQTSCFSVQDAEAISFIGNGLEAYEKSAQLPEMRYGSSFGKLFHRNLFDGLRYPDGRIAEDNAIAHRLFSPCEKVVARKERLYGYRQWDGSTMSTEGIRKLIVDTMYAFSDRREYFLAIGREDLADLAEKEMLNVIDIVRKKHNDKEQRKM